MEKNAFKKILFVTLVVIWSHMIPQSIALAQVTFPTRPVTIWVGFAAGGTTDIMARSVAEGAEKILGQKIVVIEKAGGAGVVCASLLAKQKPDGYTLGAFLDTPVTRAPHLHDLDYDPFLDLSHIIRLGFFKTAFVVRSDSPFKKWEEVVDWAKKNPGQLVYGHVGAGSIPHLGMAKVALKEGFTFKGVPFRGDAPNISAVLGGHVMIAGLSALASRPHVEAKTVRVLLVFDREGYDYAPDAPTFEKMNYDFEIPSLIIISAPKGIPDSIRERLEKALLEGIKTKTFMEVAKKNEFLLREPLTGRALEDYLRKNYLLFERLIKEVGIYKTERK